MRILLIGLATFLFSFSTGSSLFAHCQVPCGIYNDQARFVAIREDITTIDKAMGMIVTLSKEVPVNYSQISRWTTTKETHAQRIQDTVGDYFLAQRVKATASTYDAQLKLLHSVIVAAMKSKQTTDRLHIEALRASIGAFEKAYMGKNGHMHKVKKGRGWVKHN